MVDDVSPVSTTDVIQADYSSGATVQQDSSIVGVIKKKVRIKEKDVNDLIIRIDIMPLIRDIYL